MILSRGARLCESIIRNARSHRGGVRVCGRSYLARRLACSNRQVSRYLAELRAAGRLEVTPPRRVRTPTGWRTVGTNRYRLTARPHPAPHVHNRRSTRGDTHVTPLPNGSRVRPETGGPGADPGAQLIDPRAAAARLLALIAGNTS